MAAIEKGGTAYIWGVDPTSAVPITVTSFSLTEKFGIEAFVEDENGKRVAMRLDDKEFELSLEGTLKATGSLNELGTNITYKGRTYIIKEVEHRGEAKGFQKVSIKGSAYEGITLAG
jgi:hypothetical protein